MAKTDRIPDAWPALMSDVTAAAYLDVSIGFFRAAVEDGRIPKGHKFLGSSVVRWRKEQLDAVINLEWGLRASKASKSFSQDGEDEWDKAIRNAA